MQAKETADTIARMFHSRSRANTVGAIKLAKSRSGSGSRFHRASEALVTALSGWGGLRRVLSRAATWSD